MYAEYARSAGLRSTANIFALGTHMNTCGCCCRYEYNEVVPHFADPLIKKFGNVMVSCKPANYDTATLFCRKVAPLARRWRTSLSDNFSSSALISSRAGYCA